MNCPFCNARLKVWEGDWKTTYGCDDHSCEVDGMTRYKVSYYNYPTYLISRSFMLDKYYIQIDYTANTTTISTLYYILLKDSVVIPRALAVDFKNMKGLLNKIQTLLLFS